MSEDEYATTFSKREKGWIKSRQEKGYVWYRANDVNTIKKSTHTEVSTKYRTFEVKSDADRIAELIIEYEYVCETTSEEGSDHEDFEDIEESDVVE